MENFLNDAFDTYGHYTAEAPNVWATLYSDPMTKNSMLHAGEGPPEEQWHLIESTIYKNLKFYKRFIIRVARPVKEGSNVKQAQAIIIKVVYDPTQTQQPATVSGLGSMHDIGRLLDERDEKWKKELEHMKELREKDDEIAGLRARESSKKRKGDPIDRLEEVVTITGLNLSDKENTEAFFQGINGVIANTGGMLGMFLAALRGPGKAAPMQGAPGLGNIPHHRRGVPIHEQPSPGNVPAHETPDGDEVETDDEPFELTEQDELALAALKILAGCGKENPGQILYDIAMFYRNNPAMAEGLVNMANNMPQNPAA